jgi:hypothetical protein
MAVHTGGPQLAGGPDDQIRKVLGRARDLARMP